MDFNEKDIQDDNYYLETDSSMLKLNAPISRTKFFIYFLFYALWYFGTYGMYVLFGALLFPLIIISVLCLIYISFIISTCRLWDISADKTLSVIISIAVLLLCGILKLPILSLVFFLGLLFIPGKLVKS